MFMEFRRKLKKGNYYMRRFPIWAPRAIQQQHVLARDTSTQAQKPKLMTSYCRKTKMPQ